MLRDTFFPFNYKGLHITLDNYRYPCKVYAMYELLGLINFCDEYESRNNLQNACSCPAQPTWR